jgi:hypothetical protein
MIERLRALLDRPLEPAVARAVLLLALAVGSGLATVVALAGLDRQPSIEREATMPTSSESRPAAPAAGTSEMPAQDPQDRPGSEAHRRAAAELADHRALQHVPFEGDGALIDLFGARGGRAVLRVEASSVAAGRRAWKAFLRRYHDPGDAYVPIFGTNRTRRES